MGKLKKNAILFLVGVVGAKIISVFFLRFYTSVLSTEEYGIIDVIIVLSSLIVPISTLSIDSAVLRFLLDDDSDTNKVLKVGIGVSILGFLSFVVFFPFLAHYISTTYAVCLYVSVFFIATYNVLGSYYKGVSKVEFFSLGSIINAFVFASSNIIFLKCFKLGIKGYMYAYILSYIAPVLFFVTCFRGASIRKKRQITDIQLMRKMLKYSVPLVANNISWWINDSIDRFALLFYKGASVTGLYSVANKIPMIVNLLSTAFINAWQISTVDVVGDRKKAEGFYNKVSDYYSSMLLVACATIIVFSKLFAFLLFSKDFFEAWRFVPVLVFSVLFCNLSAFYGGILTAYKSTTMILISTAAGALINILFNVILIPDYGAFGASVATCLGYSVNMLCRLINIKIKYGYSFIKTRQVLSVILLLTSVYLIIHDFVILAFVLFGGIIALLYKNLVDLFRVTFTQKSENYE